MKTPEKPNLAWRYSLLCCIQNVIEAKVHDLCVTLVGVALSYILSHFILCNQVVGALGNDFLGLCIT